MTSSYANVNGTLTVSSDEGIAQVTLVRPDVRNRFDAALHGDLVEALTGLRTQREVRAVVLASTGTVFSAGGDFDHMLTCRADADERRRLLREAGQLFGLLIDMPMPVVAALHGDAVGLGATIVLACDAVVASRTANIADPHVAIGLVAGDGGCVVWPQAAGMLRARRYLLTGDSIPAERALAFGLVTDLVEGPGDALPAARAIAARMAALPPLAVQGTKQVLNRLVQQRSGEVMDLALALESTSMGSDDLAEAIAAFKGRRPPSYSGR